MTFALPRFRRSSRLAAALVAATLAGAAPAALAAAQPAPPTAQQSEQADLQRIQQYLNSIRTLSAHVTQYADNGSVAQGTLYVSRPGRMRLAYDPPSPVLLVADGTFVIYYDKRLQQVSYLPIGSTPAWFLLRDRISLGGGVRVTGFEHRGGVIRVTLVESEEPQAGSVTLTFTDQPLALRQWTVTDAQGHHTTVALSNVRIGGKIDPDLFVFNEPHRKEPGGR